MPDLLHTRKAVLSCAVVLAALSGLQASPAVGGVGGKAPAGNVRVWTPQFMGGKPSRTRLQALADARHFRVIVAHAGTYRNHVAAMKRERPKLSLLVYMNGTATWEADLAESVYAHNANGQRIRIRGWSSTFLLDPSSPTAIAYQKARAASLLASSGYHGLYIDALGPMALRLDYVTSLPVNPSTGEVWTRAAWMQRTTALAAAVRQSIAPRPIVGNGLGGGGAYFLPEAPTKTILASGIHGGVAESWLRAATQSLTAYPPASAWRQNVVMLADAAGEGTSLMTMTKVWSSGTSARKRRWHKFALGSYLLGNTGHAYFGFSYENGDSTVPRRLNRVKLGDATGASRQARGYYTRTFTGGKVWVNPTAESYRVNLRRRLRTLSGSWVSSFSLGPYSAQILKR